MEQAALRFHARQIAQPLTRRLQMLAGDARVAIKARRIVPVLLAGPKHAPFVDSPTAPILRGCFTTPEQLP